MSALEIIDQIPEFAELLALEIRRLNSPREDELSQNQAFHKYGRAWIEKYVRAGQLHRVRKGGKVVFSTSEIERVRAKERAARESRKDAGLVFTYKRR